MTSLSTPPWYRQFWPWFIMLPPAVAMVGGFMTLWIALQHADSVLPDRLSRVGLAVQPDHAVGASGASFTIHPQTGLLHLHVDGDVSTTPLTLRWLHPTLPERDQITVLRPMAPGEYEARPPDALDEVRLLRLESAAGWVLEGRWQPHAPEIRLFPLISREG